MATQSGMLAAATAPPQSQLILGTLVALPLAILCSGWLLARSRRQAIHLKYAQKAEQKRREVAEALAQAKEAGLSWEGFQAWCTAQPKRPPGPPQVLAMTATELCKALANGAFSAEYLVRLYIARSMLVDEKLNCVTEQRYEAAVAEARVCDAERLSGSLRGPLHGLPVSIKEQISERGFDTTCGACCRLFKPRDADALLVTLLKDAGAIPFCRTNVPQLLMLPETFNAIYGTSSNPFDLARTPGGSSGGEGALVAARGSPLGLGTDVGGSIRIPAVFNGICGFKPTVDRLTYKGIAVPRKNDSNGQTEVRSAPGPLGRCVDDLEAMMAVLCTPRMYVEDPILPPLAWDSGVYAAAAASPRLTFGYYVSDGWFEPAPACARAVHETIAALRAAGHNVVRFEPTELVELIRLYLAILAADGNFRGFVDGIEGEALHPSYSFLRSVASIPNALRPLLAAIHRNLLSQPRMADIILVGKGKSAQEYWQTIAQRNKLQKAFIARFEEAKLDGASCAHAASTPRPGLTPWPPRDSMCTCAQ